MGSKSGMGKKIIFVFLLLSFGWFEIIELLIFLLNQYSLKMWSVKKLAYLNWTYSQNFGDTVLLESIHENFMVVREVRAAHLEQINLLNVVIMDNHIVNMSKANFKDNRIQQYS